MKTLTIDLPGREYDILIGRGLLSEAGERCRAVLPRARKLFVVTDSNVGPLYWNRLKADLEQAGFQICCHVIPAGEASKSAGQLAELWEAMMAFGLTRTDAVIALGGGVVGDLAGFAAATVLRGVDFVQIPTTLLAQVDSSVGGKVAVDLRAGKNLAGAFWQPRLVLIDPDVLDTLPEATFADGMAEVIKYGFIADASFAALLERCGNRAGVMERIEEVLSTCCAIKAEVVRADERDTGARMVLNFGHTLGHAYEKAGNYERYTHGQAVAAGMCRAAELGVFLHVTPAEVPARVAALVKRFGLPTAIPCTMEDYRQAVGTDKKGTGEDLSLILLEGVGSAQVKKLPKAQVIKLLEEMA